AGARRGGRARGRAGGARARHYLQRCRVVDLPTRGRCSCRGTGPGVDHPPDRAGRGLAHLAARLSCPLAPMIGCIGVAAATGEMSTVMPSYPTGGNMDLTDVAPGSTVYLPVQVAGALLSIGDLHAVMARGESTFVAIEAAGQA